MVVVVVVVVVLGGGGIDSGGGGSVGVADIRGYGVKSGLISSTLDAV